jgi:CheY-like chemotaxis protein
MLHFCVSDTGIGIPEDKRAAIFEMFEQGDASMTRRHGGTGLGLAIASRLVEMMDGRIWVESDPGHGSQFHFAVRLGLADPGHPLPPPPEPPCLHGMRVLVVDDNATNRRILEEIVRSWGMEPTVVRNAAEALEAMRHAQAAGAPFRLVLTDAHMPSVDGFMLAEQIRQDPAMSSAVVMMLTSGDRPDDASRCEQLGISGYLLKPIKQSELLEAIETTLGLAVAGPSLAETAEAAPRSYGNLRILLAEDSLFNQKLAVALLEGQRHAVTVVNNGQEAVEVVASQSFDLVLMDVQMPIMDGLEATTHIRAREQETGSHVPIIAMTAHALKGDRERCLEAGMDGYVAKPIRARELFEAIDRLFGGGGSS